MKKNIVVISTMYYPFMGAPSVCVDRYVRGLKDEYNFFILTKSEIADFEPSKEYKITYISSPLHRLRQWCNANLRDGKKKALSKISLMGINAIRLIQTQFFLPNAQRWEIKAYRKALESLNESVGLDGVIAVANTFLPQLATLEFKRKHPEVNWIAFITDPFAENYIYYKFKVFKKIWKNKNLKKEQEIYNECDSVLATSEMYKYIPTAFKIDQRKLHKMNFPLQDISQFKEECPLKIQDGKRCKLIYGGMFYRSIRNPEFALSVLSKIPGIEVQLFVPKGECEGIITKYSSTNIIRHYHVAREEYMKMIFNEYNILINIGNNATLQAPSKMLELLSTGKPIINFYKVKDEQFEMIEKYPLGINIGDSEDEAATKIERFCREMKGRCISFDEVSRLFPENNLQSEIDKMRGLLEHSSNYEY